MSEAEVVLGVDHFNWLQQIDYVPGYWQPVTLVGLNYNDLANLVVDNKGNFTYSDTGAKVTALPRNLPLVDPIMINSDSDPMDYTRAFVITNPQTGATDYVLWPSGGTYTATLADGTTATYSVPYPDAYFYLWSEDPSDQDSFSLANNTTSTSLLFSDEPVVPSYAFLTSPTDADGGYIGFQTSLVGVNYDPSSYVTWQNSGYTTNFDWESNSADGGNLGGIVNVFGWGQGSPSTEPPVASGGVFNVQLTSQPALLAGLALGAIPNQNVAAGGTASVAAVANDPAEGAAFSYSLGPGAPAAAAIDPKTGLFTWAVPASEPGGKYPITVKVSDNSSPPRSASQTFDIIVQSTHATLTLSGLNSTYDGTAHRATVTTDPPGLTGVTVVYSQGDVVVPTPTQVGSYTVTASLNNPSYTAASVTGTLVINPAIPIKTQAVIVGEQPLFQRKPNKKGKPTGSPVLIGFTFDFSVPLNSSAASAPPNTRSIPSLPSASRRRKRRFCSRSSHSRFRISRQATLSRSPLGPKRSFQPAARSRFSRA